MTPDPSRWVIDAWMWAREPKDADGNRRDQESVRWIEGYERLRSKPRYCRRHGCVCDRPRGDIAELMARAQELGQPADW
ncbi:protein of unknown function (plasmid) [Cupriavidus taiwanensis]|nr:protein of unknown function [Cupriavidus taiwanensis]